MSHQLVGQVSRQRRQHLGQRSAPMMLAFKIKIEDVLSQKHWQTTDQRGLANQVWTVHDKQATIKGELLLYPDQGIIAAKKHLRAFDGPSRMIGVDQIAQNRRSILGVTAPLSSVKAG